MSDRYVLSGVLRGVQAEAARAERQRILTVLNEASLALRAEARKSVHPNLTGAGRRARALDWAAATLISPRDNPWAGSPGAHHGGIENGCDTIDIFWYDPDPADNGGEEEPLPVRLVTHDGAESITATAYISLDEALRLIDQLTGAVRAVQIARRKRARVAQAEQGGA